MVKFILIMFICSNIPGNQCKSMSIPIQTFETHRECILYGYEYSLNMLKDFNVKSVNEYKIFTSFSCKKSQSQSI